MDRWALFPNNDLISQYRQVFSGGVGRSVLAHMLFDLGAFMVLPDTPEHTVLRNYGNRLLAILAGGDLAEETINAFAKALVKQPLPKETKE